MGIMDSKNLLEQRSHPLRAKSEFKYESNVECGNDDDVGNITLQKVMGCLNGEVCESEEFEDKNCVTNDESIELLQQRKTVICSVKDVTQVETSDGEESSGGSSIVLDDESDAGDDHSKEFSSGPTDNEPTADPSEIECVVTDTSGDESTDAEDCDPLNLDRELESSKSSKKKLSCSLCAFAALDGGGSKDLLQHLQTFHKFAIRWSRSNANSESDGESLPGSENATSKGIVQQKKCYTCCKTRGGCGSVFFSKQGLLSHHSRSKSAGGLCWLAATRNDQGKPLHFCSICSFQDTSRKKMLQHLETYHNCLKNFDSAMAAFTLGCRICDEQFWTVSERSKHEVSQHLNEATYLILKCNVCFASFSSMVCLKNHMRADHREKEQFVQSIGFRCRTCHLTFPSFVLVQEHFRSSHKSLLVFRCQKCSIVLKTKKTYHVHLKSTQCGTIRHECKLCNKVLWSRRALSLHFRMKHFKSISVGFLCRICKQRFNSKPERAQHYTSEHQGDNPFTCPICKKGFASKSGMYGHRQIHVKTSICKCEFCGKEFSRRDSYNEHMLIHNGPRHKCPHCEKQFVQRSNLVRHIRIHTGEKPYKCSFCAKTFSDKGACNSHIRVHTREEACSCPYCGQIFSKKQKLKYHIRKHTGEDLVSCEFCGKNFTNSHSLKEHRTIHDRRTQLLCSQCGKAFSTPKYLQRHIAIVHEATLMYKCPVCSRGFNQQAKLKAHLMTHTSIKHLRCLLCTKAYSTRKSLRCHLLNVHNVTLNHPDYKQCFYAMTPEEVGLKISEEELSCKWPKPSMRKIKAEPLSADSDFGENSSSSEEEEEDDSSEEPPQLVQEEPLNSSIIRPPPFPTIRTKAAMKQLPFNVVLNEKKIDKVSKSSRHVKPCKTLVQSVKNKTSGQKQVLLKDQFPVSFESAGFPESSLIQSRQDNKNLSKPETELSKLSPSGVSKKDSPRNTKGISQNRNKKLLSGDRHETKSISNQNTSTKPSLSSASKSNRRARYKLQTPKKRVICEEVSEALAHDS